MRQYIGARYTIKIYENSLDHSSAQWEANTSYERLTMVTDNNSSFLSKKDVPASIGAPASNPDYWTETGFYNGQIAALQAQIDTINNTTIPGVTTAYQAADNVVRTDLQTQIDRIVDPVIVIDSDSYGYPSTGNWVAEFINYMGLSSGEYYNITASQMTGASFYSPTPMGNFLDRITWLVGTLTAAEKARVTDVLIISGINDSQPYANMGGSTTEAEAYAYLKGKIADFASFVKANLPNALITLGFDGNVEDTADYRKMDFVKYALQAYIDASGENDNMRFIDGLQYIMHDYVFMSADHIHPTADGGKEIAKLAANAMRGGQICFDRSEYFSANDLITTGTGVTETYIDTVTASGDCAIRLTNNVLMCNLGRGLAVRFTSAQTIADHTNIKIGKISSDKLLHGKPGRNFIPISGYYYDTNNAVLKKLRTAWIIFNEGQVIIYIDYGSEDINESSITTNLLSLTLPPFTIDTMNN